MHHLKAITNLIVLQGGYQQMVRTGSVSSYMDDGYVPDYHTGRKMSAQYEVIFQKKSSSRTDCFTLEMNSAPKIVFQNHFL